MKKTYDSDGTWLFIAPVPGLSQSDPAEKGLMIKLIIIENA